MGKYKNELTLAGHVSNAYEKNNILFVTMFVKYEHDMNGMSVREEKPFRVMMTNRQKILSCPVRKNDFVEVRGYLSKDYKLTEGGNEKSYLNVYANEIRILEYANN